MRDTYFLASFQSLLFCEGTHAGAVFGDWGTGTGTGDLIKRESKHRIKGNIAAQNRRKKCTKIISLNLYTATKSY